MKIPVIQFKSTLVAAIVVTLAACGDSGGGGGGGLDLPASAARITQANAGDIASQAVGSLDGMGTLTDAATSLRPAAEGPSYVAVTQLLVRRVIASHFYAARSASEDCGPNPGDGSVSGEITETASSAEGEISFNMCNLFGLILDGEMRFDSSFNATSGDYNASFSGEISITFSGEPTVTLAFDASESGNEFNGNYTLDATISVDAPPDQGMLLDTTDPLDGNYFTGEIFDGTMIAYGAGNTRLRMDFIATDLVDVDIDEGSGSFEDYDVVDINDL